MYIPKRTKALTTLIVAASGLSTAAFAEEEPETQQETTIETVAVVGQATNALITADQIQSYQAQDLVDVFRHTPSVSVGGSLGIAQKIYIRGLEDNFVNVTVDGAPQTSTLFHHIGRVTIDPDLLKQVEVQAGAGEATSGAGSIGGAIRFKTKNVDDLLAPGDAFGGKVKASHFTNDGDQYSISLYGRLAENWGFLAYYNDTNRENFEDGNGDEVLGTASDQSLGFLKVNGRISDNQSLSLSYENRNEEADFSARPNWHVQPGETLYASEAERETYVANYALHQGNLLSVEATLYDTSSSFSGGRFDWFTEISSTGFDVRNTSQLGDHRLVYGVDYRDDQVDSGDPLNAREEGNVLGIYAQAHSQLTNQLLLSYGVRYDDYEFEQKVLPGDAGEPSKFDDSDISLNAGLSYELTEHWVLGVGYAEAYRGKEVGDGFTIEKPSVGVAVDNDLKGETVSNIEASAEYSDENLNVKLAIFESKIDDVIFNQLYSGNLYDNAGTVETSGFELDMAYRWGNFNIFAGYSDVDSEFDPKAGYYTQDFSSIKLSAYEFRHLGNSRGDTWNFGVDYTPRPDLKTGINIVHVEELKMDTLYQDVNEGWVPELYQLSKDSYTTVDIFAEWQATQALSLNVAVINLLDKHYRDHSSVGDYTAIPGYELVAGPWEAGRDIRLSVSYSF
ncbi:MAG: TonB-dependent receptor [Spongiibacter sp.]|nr:TonB-dependent receptor [Spongiibacter sp.]MAK44889.1 TonB-dependent receptor [Spongiibacter sp.]|tara:strand:- start:276 stop:2303 length:2028 start_codon:yes stop_codon:yes gene_type:complete